MRKSPIYLDHNATTPTHPDVLNAMMPYFLEHFGNAASQSHSYGWQAKAALDQARASLARSLRAENPESFIFTSGTTESNNLALKGVVHASRQKKAHIITQATEHSCVLESLVTLRREGHEITILDVDENGHVDLDEFRQAFRSNTVLASVMWANNEVGTIQDIPALLKITREFENVLFHTDAAQTVGKIPIDLQNVPVDLMSFSAHKIYGPKGIGALYVAPHVSRSRLEPILHGGGHEFGLRSGTVNVPGAVGFAKALELCLQDLPNEMKRQSELRDHLIQNVLGALDLCFLNGDPVRRLPNNISLCFEGVEADTLILKLPELAVSSGAACASGGTEPSYVIQALGRSREQAKSTLRLSLGRQTSAEDMETAEKLLIQAVKTLREKSLVYEMLKNQKH